MKRLIHWILVEFGLRNCCDKQNILEVHNSQYYYEFKCLSCGHVQRGWLGRNM